VLAVTIPIAGRFADRIAVSRMVSAGLVLLAASFFLMLGVGTATALALITLWAVIGRLGLGMILPSLNLGSMQGVANAMIAQGSSTINFLRQLGGAVGIGLVGNVLEWRLRTHAAAAARRLSRNLRARRRDHRLRHHRRLAHGSGPATERDPTRPPALMNLDLDLLPERCDAIVVGAGPAGAAAAQWLARPAAASSSSTRRRSRATRSAATASSPMRTVPSIASASSPR
jgi:hypothetical protein